MAYDGFRSPPPAEQPNFYDYVDSQPSQSSRQQSTPYHSDNETHRYQRQREDSASVSDGYNSDQNRFQQTQPSINAAVTSAFNQAESSNALPPEVLSQITSQITQNVIQQLQGTKLATNLKSSDAPQAQPTPMAANGQVPASPSTHSGGSPNLSQRKVYTPPSPQRADEHFPPQSPVSNPSPSKSTHPAHERDPASSERKTVSPLSQASHVNEPSRREGKRDISQERRRDDDNMGQSRVRRDSNGRPRGPTRLCTGDGETTVEKIWGPLFDEQGHPTMRLGQFLRGIAVHIIEDYEPLHSLVITPQKMQKYYADTKVTSEAYPWQDIFDDRYSSISRLYRNVEAQHHLIQERYDERPDIPGLTPIGFERWVTLLIQANPAQEFERLAATVRNMPISNPDDKKERFPKDISRRLFPNDQDHRVRAKVEKAMKTHCNIDLPKNSYDRRSRSRSAHRPSDASARQASSTPVPSSVPERERQPYAGSTTGSTTGSTATSSDVIEDDEDTPTPQPIERERKPYSAQPGGGKNYDGPSRPPTVPMTSAPSGPKLGRTTSSASQTRPFPENMAGTPTGTRPIPISQPHRMSNAPPPPASMTDTTLPLPSEASFSQNSGFGIHPRSNSIHHSKRANRARSPSANMNGFHRSEGDVSNFAPPYGSSYPVSDMDTDRKVYRDYDARDGREQARMSMYDMPSREPPRGRYGYAPPSHHPSYGGREPYPGEEDYYRNGGRPAPVGNGYDYNQGYPPSYR
ncbi:MAG: hypothetical protein Q9160_003337 [Pyrenula sp. 1 TL-2023]